MTGPFEHAAGAGAQGKDVPRATQFRWPCGWVEGHLNRGGAVFGGDAGGHPMFDAGIDAHGEGRFVGIGVAVHHQRQIQFVQPLPLHGQTDQAPCLGGHEVDRFRGGELGRADQIAFVLPLFVVHHDNAFPIADRRQGVADGIKRDRFVRGVKGTGVQEPGRREMTSLLISVRSTVGWLVQWQAGQRRRLKRWQR